MEIKFNFNLKSFWFFAWPIVGIIYALKHICDYEFKKVLCWTGFVLMIAGAIFSPLFFEEIGTVVGIIWLWFVISVGVGGIHWLHTHGEL